VVYYQKYFGVELAFAFSKPKFKGEPLDYLEKKAL